MKKTPLLLSIAFISVGLFFIGLYLDSYVLRMVAKPIPLIMLLLLLKRETHFGKFIFGGLVFSLIGDVLLESSPDMFVFGLLAFLTGHIFYIIALTRRNRDINLTALIALVVYGVGIYGLLYPGLDKMAIPVLLYIIVILTMAWRAVSQRSFNEYAKFAMIGSFFFVFSDSLIAVNKFYTPIDYSRGVIMLSYWTAQAFIFYSAFKSDDA